MRIEAQDICYFSDVQICYHTARTVEEIVAALKNKSVSTFYTTYPGLVQNIPFRPNRGETNEEELDLLGFMLARLYDVQDAFFEVTKVCPGLCRR